MIVTGSLDTDSILSTKLVEGLSALGLDLSVSARQDLLAYVELIERWNRTYNLTAIREPGDMVVHHLLDSLAVLTLREKFGSTSPTSHGPVFTVADVGSGAGLPGIPWAIAEPAWQVTSIEAVAKKAAFQRQVKIELGLSNIEILSQRVERVIGRSFDLIVSRAFASLEDFVRLAGHLINEGGGLCAMKGVRPDQEIEHLPNGWWVDGTYELHVPGLNAQRHVLILRKH